MELFTTATTDNKTCIVRLSRILSKVKCVFEYVKGLNLRSLSDQENPFDVREGFIFMVKALFSHLYIGHLFIRAYSFTRSFIPSFAYSPNHSFAHSAFSHFFPSFAYSSVHPFIYSVFSFTCSFLQSLARFCPILRDSVTYNNLTCCNLIHTHIQNLGFDFNSYRCVLSLPSAVRRPINASISFLRSHIDQGWRYKNGDNIKEATEIKLFRYVWVLFRGPVQHQRPIFSMLNFPARWLCTFTWTFWRVFIRCCALFEAKSLAHVPGSLMLF